jgi:putative methionine-R-sulfoxide reductase with GAF domain
MIDGDGDVFAVLDVDSDRLDDFSDADRIGLERIVNLIRA